MPLDRRTVSGENLPSPGGRGARGEGNDLPSSAGTGARGRGNDLPSPTATGARGGGNDLPSPTATGARGKGSALPSPSGRGARGEGKPLPSALLERARALRRDATDAERLLWSLLRNRQFLGLKFRRQHPLGGYILDFYCHEARLGVELDGGQHAEPEQATYDAQRTRDLAELGVRVVRFWNHEVLKETDAVLEAIMGVVEDYPHPKPLSHGERGSRSEKDGGLPSPGGKGARDESSDLSSPAGREGKGGANGLPSPGGRGAGGEGGGDPPS